MPDQESEHGRRPQGQPKAEPVGPGGRVTATGHQDFLAQAPPELRREIDELRRYRSQIGAGLKQEEISALFLKDPAAALQKLGVPLSASLRKRLDAAKGALELERQRAFTLPNGQVIRPKVKIRITEEGA